MSEINNKTFNGLRSQLYKQSLQQYPEARNMDKEIMELFLDPQSHETILEVGAGS
jgi:protein-L-isoaspartate O-methyltransferase